MRLDAAIAAIVVTGLAVALTVGLLVTGAGETLAGAGEPVTDAGEALADSGEGMRTPGPDCHAGVVPDAALAGQPGPVFCEPLPSGPGTAVPGDGTWTDRFDHGLRLAGMGGSGYRTFVTAGVDQAAFWRHADHWMVDVAPSAGDSGGALLRPRRPQRFVDGRLSVEVVTAAGHADYGATAWPEIVVTTAQRPTAPRQDGLYAYDHFRHHPSLGCRLEADRTPVCALMDATPRGAAQGGRVWEMSFHQQAGTESFGGGPWGPAAAAWRTCAVDDDPDTACRDRFRLELSATSLTLRVNGVRYFAQSGLPALPDELLDGDVYVYAASMTWLSEADVVRFHWDDLVVNGRGGISGERG